MERERERERKEGGREGCVCGEKRDRGMRESTLHRRARVLGRAAHMRGGGATKWGFCYKNKHKAHTRGQSKKESRGNNNHKMGGGEGGGALCAVEGEGCRARAHADWDKPHRRVRARGTMGWMEKKGGAQREKREKREHGPRPREGCGWTEKNQLSVQSTRLPGGGVPRIHSANTPSRTQCLSLAAT